MHELASEGLWQRVGRMAKGATAKKAAVAYVSNDSVIKFGTGDTLVVDASDAAIRAGETSAHVIARAVRRGADVYSSPGLHAKVILLDGQVVIGSANISASSAKHLVELALLSDQPSLVAEAHGFVETLRKKSDNVDAAFIRRIKAIRILRRGGRGGRKRSGVRPRQPVTWIVRLSDIDEDAYPDEKSWAESGLQKAEQHKTKSSSDVTWARITGQTGFRRRAKKDDLIIVVYREPGQRRRTVYAPAPILRRQDEPTCTRFYYEEYRNLESTALPYSSFRALLESAGFHGRLGKWPARAISRAQSDAISVLWNTSK